jgi:hypothetical protein
MATRSIRELRASLWDILITRASLMGVGVGTVAAIGYDAVHSGSLDSGPVLPIILLWSLAELIFHWQRTGQLQPPAQSGQAGGTAETTASVPA